MRIPSQFNGESLYRRGSRRPNPADSTRRIFRLVVALILVIVVMQQASKPRVYEIFFSEDTTGGDTAGPDSVAGTGNPVTVSQHSRVKDLPVSENTRRVAQQLTAAMPTNEQRQWTVMLSRWDTGKSFPMMRAVGAQAIAAVGQFSEIEQTERDAWTEALNRFGQLYAESELVVGRQQKQQPEPEPTAAEDHEVSLSDEDKLRLVTWLAALDSAADQRVVDGSVWRSDDFDAFYRQLDQSESLSAAGAASVSVVPLLQEPDIYRGKLVRISGTIALAEPKQATANPYAIEKYWQLWIKPDAGSDRPIVTIVRQIPNTMAEFVQRGGQPQVRLVGRFFKRLAYRSKLGADLAPVVIGRLNLPKPAPLATTTAPEPSQRFHLWTTAAIALMFGVTLAVLAMRLTSASARRSREIRRLGQAPELSGLSDAALNHKTEEKP